MAYQKNLKIDQLKNAIYRKFIRAKNLHSKEIYHLKFKWYKSMINDLLRLTNQNTTKHFSVNTKQTLCKSRELWGL